MIFKRLLFVILITIPVTTFAQTGSQRGSGTPTVGISGADGIYYIDEVGIRLATDGMPMEGFIDPETYTLGSLDILSIEIRGTIPVTFRGLIVNSMGDIIIPTVGNVQVGDLTFTNASQLIRSKISEKYASQDIHVTLEKPKPVHVHVTGDIKTPGRFIFPAQTRVDAVVLPVILGIDQSSINGVQVQTGPSLRRTIGGQLAFNRNPVAQDDKAIESDISEILNQYALRKVHIRHRDGRESFADLTAYFNGGILESNPFVKDGEVITIYRKNEFEPRTGISGGVRFAFEGEFRSDDTVGKLMRMAGGYTEVADTTYFWIYRYATGDYVTERLEGSLFEHDEMHLNPNDRVMVPIIPRQRQSITASIDGEVMQTGKFPMSFERATVYELIQLSGGLTGDALAKGAYIERDLGRAITDGADKLEANMIKRSSDQLAEGFQYLEFEQELSSRYIFVDLRNEEQMRSIRLIDGDKLFIPRDDQTVLVFGQVNRTGYYPANNGDNLPDFLSQAGGLSLAADPSRIFVIKAGNQAWYKPSDTTVESGDKIFVDRIPYDDLQASRTHELQMRQLRNNNIQVILSTIGTVAAVITAYIAVTR